MNENFLNIYKTNRILLLKYINDRSNKYFCFQVHTAIQQTGFKRVKRGYRPLPAVKRGFRPLSLPETRPATEPRDPYFPLQWYLKNTGQNGGKPKLDLNVEAAWALGYTGVNVTTAIMDDGKTNNIETNVFLYSLVMKQDVSPGVKLFLCL